MQPNYRLKSIFPGNYLCLLQLEIQTDQPRVILDTNKGEEVSLSEQFPSPCFESRKLYESPHSRMSKRDICTRHTNSLPGYHTYTKSSHKREPSYLQDVKLSSWNRWALLKYATATLQTTNTRAWSLIANWQLCISLNRCPARLTIPGFAWHFCSWPGGMMLVWEPHVLPTNQGFESHR